MTSADHRVFALPASLAAKDDRDLVAADEAHLTAVADALTYQVAELTSRLATARRTPVRAGEEALARDQEVHRLSARLRMLRRFSLDLCLGRMVFEDGRDPLYVGRLGLTARDGRRLMVDWRSPAAEPFFAATHARPMGLVSRRRYRWRQGRIVDFWDEVFDVEAIEGHAALDDQSEFLASLGETRTDRMRDVLTTIAADQDAIIRADSRGPLVVDGGPGTGKTVVALHRAAYLIHADPRLGQGRGGVLFVGPHQPYLAYVSDVLPSLGEEGVLTCTIRDLLPEGAGARPETDPEVLRLKSDARMVEAIEPAVGLYEEPPTRTLLVETPWAEVALTAADWAEAFAAPDPGTPHNEAREQIRDALIDIVVDGHEYDEDLSPDDVRRALARQADLHETLNRAWPLIEPTDLVGDLWEVPAYLRRCAPWLTAAEVRRLQRDEPQAWTDADLPLLDAARFRLGDPEAGRRQRRQETARVAEKEEMDRVVEHLIATDDSEMLVMSMLRGEDLQAALDSPAVEIADPDGLAGPFAHVVVDEAQELTDAQWQMLLRRCPSRSLTIVGDRAQARHGFVGSWAERLARAGLGRARVASLTVNYRTPAEVMAEAEPVIRAVMPDAGVPTSIRRSGIPVTYAAPDELAEILTTWATEHPEGIGCVIGVGTPSRLPAGLEARLRTLTPELAKGLEFDLVVLLEPDSFGDGVEGAVDTYVAMTRATQRLVVLRG